MEHQVALIAVKASQRGAGEKDTMVSDKLKQQLRGKAGNCFTASQEMRKWRCSSPFFFNVRFIPRKIPEKCACVHA